MSKKYVATVRLKHREEIIEMLMSGKTPKEIAKKLGVTYNQAYYYFTLLGLKSDAKETTMKDQILKRLKKGMRQCDIARELGPGKAHFKKYVSQIARGNR